MPVLGALARWGYDWTWTGPRGGEDINVGAIFRLAPGLLAPPADVAGTVDLVLADDHDERVFRLRAEGGRVTITERPEGAADAVVSGSEEAWISALGPDGAIGSLNVDGMRSLAEALLSGFTGAATSRAAQRAA
jgi:regulator of protease activity HflC (stomatin/prohibitin superfamily)